VVRWLAWGAASGPLGRVGSRLLRIAVDRVGGWESLWRNRSFACCSAALPSACVSRLALRWRLNPLQHHAALHPQAPGSQVVEACGDEPVHQRGRGPYSVRHSDLPHLLDELAFYPYLCMHVFPSVFFSNPYLRVFFRSFSFLETSPPILSIFCTTSNACATPVYNSMHIG
jgi:hypothetical protein